MVWGLKMKISIPNMNITIWQYILIDLQLVKIQEQTKYFKHKYTNLPVNNKVL